MKKGGFLRRKTRLKTKTKIKAVNAKRKAKKRAKYKTFMASRVWKEIRQACIARAGKRCEYLTAEGRCTNTTYLQCHHKTYRRFGGKERPEDLECLCRWHHKLVEDALRPWNKNRRAS